MVLGSGQRVEIHDVQRDRIVVRIRAGAAQIQRLLPGVGHDVAEASSQPLLSFELEGVVPACAIRFRSKRGGRQQRKGHPVLNWAGPGLQGGVLHESRIQAASLGADVRAGNGQGVRDLPLQIDVP